MVRAADRADRDAVGVRNPGVTLGFLSARLNSSIDMGSEDIEAALAELPRECELRLDAIIDCEGCGCI